MKAFLSIMTFLLISSVAGATSNYEFEIASFAETLKHRCSGEPAIITYRDTQNPDNSRTIEIDRLVFEFNPLHTLESLHPVIALSDEIIGIMSYIDYVYYWKDDGEQGWTCKFSTRDYDVTRYDVTLFVFDGQDEIFAGGFE